jgi:hypothetical protein
VWAALTVFVGVVSTGSCTFASNLDALSNGDCPPGQKACNRECVAESNPNWGCALIGCTPCNFSNATATCAQHGECAIAACVAPFQDCNRQPSDGCEVDVAHDPGNCGVCSKVCPPVAHGTPGCTGGHCVVGACDAGWDDCNLSAIDGCETRIDMAANCGACAAQCTSSQTCVCSADGGRGCRCA